MKWFPILALGVGAFVAASRPTANPYYDRGQPHHRENGFQNNHIEFEPKGMVTFLQWQWDA